MFLTNIFSNRVGSDSQNGSQTHEVQNIANFNSQSLLQNFPSIPFEKTIFGCYESNAQFQFSFSHEFDKNLLSVSYINLILYLFINKTSFFFPHRNITCLFMIKMT